VTEPAAQPPGARLPGLRGEIIGAFALVFTGALFVAAAGIVLVVPMLEPLAAALWFGILLAADIAIFSWFGAVLLERRLLRPLDELVEAVEAISSGSLDTRLPPGGSRELARLGAAVAQMSGRLLSDRQTLAENVRSLDETNQMLTEARDAMIRTEKLASVGRLGAGIAHEVGNPLGAIMGYLGLLARRTEGQQQELVLSAEREATRIDRIIRGLLDYARPREPVAQPVDVAGVVAGTVDLVSTQGHFSNVTVERQADAGLMVQGDPYQLQQVLVNLLVNACDAMESTADPRIVIRAVRRAARPAPAYLPARRSGDPAGVDYSHRRRLNPATRWPSGDPDTPTGDVVEITVTDNGPGVPPDIMEKVFEPFFTTREVGKGTGLGLALSARLVEAMGGAVNVGNAEDGGAIFSVVLPALPPAA
jgi:two-component system, NtrC family, sensor kinase